MTDQQVTATVDEASAGTRPQQVQVPEQLPSEPDPQAAAAVDLARRAAEEVAQPGTVGRHLSVSVDSSGLTLHAFDSTAKGYRGWRWAVTLAHVPGSDRVTVCDTVLLPGADSILAPDWVPWSDRLAPGDLGAGDELPFKLEDPYLVPGYTVTDEEDADQELFWELGLGRARVLGPEGITAAADRWHRGSHGPTAEIAIQAAASCVTCAYFVPLSGVMRQAFGACANEWSPADGSVVTADFGCGAHSETDLEMPAPEPLSEHILDETVVDRMDLEVAEAAGPGPGIETGSMEDAGADDVVEVTAVTGLVEEEIQDAAGGREITGTVASVREFEPVRDAGGTSKDVVPAESAPPVPIQFEPTLDPEPVASPEDVITVRPLNEAPDRKAESVESVESARTATDELIQGGVVATGSGTGSAEVESAVIEVVQVEVAAAAPGGEVVRPEPESDPVPPPAWDAEAAAGQPESVEGTDSSSEAALGEALEPVSAYSQVAAPSEDAAVLSEDLAVPGETILESDGVLAAAPVEDVQAGEIEAVEALTAAAEDGAAETAAVGDGHQDEQTETAAVGDGHQDEQTETAAVGDGHEDEQTETAAAGDGGVDEQAPSAPADEAGRQNITIAIDSAVAAATPDPVAQPVIEALDRAGDRDEVQGPGEVSDEASDVPQQAQASVESPVGTSGEGSAEVSAGSPDRAPGETSPVAPEETLSEAETPDGAPSQSQVPAEVPGDARSQVPGEIPAEGLNAGQDEAPGGEGKPETEVPAQP